jgi:hypothetical protein
MRLLSKKSIGRIEQYWYRVNEQTSKRDLCHQEYYREPFQPSFLTGTMAPKSVRLHLPMRPVDNITELDANAKFLSDIWPAGPGKAFYEFIKY